MWFRKNKQMDLGEFISPNVVIETFCHHKNDDKLTLSLSEDKVRLFLKAQKAFDVLGDILDTYQNNKRESKKIIDIVSSHDESLLDYL